nr:DUF3836 domain-containing protein [Bacteroides sp.]
MQHQKEQKLKKINSMNATVILSAVMVMATSVASVSNFAYNSEINNGKVESQTVYEVQDQKYLQPHLKYNYTYDEQNRLIQKEVLKWNKQTLKYEKDRCLTITYAVDETAVEYASWNTGTNAYSTIKEKAIYRENEMGIAENYQSYSWNERQNKWSLVVEHATLGWEEALLAVK